MNTNYVHTNELPNEPIDWSKGLPEGPQFGFKVLNDDLTSTRGREPAWKLNKKRTFRGKTLKLAKSGYHFSQKLENVQDYVSGTILAFVQAEGEIISSDSYSKCVTRSLTILSLTYLGKQKHIGRKPALMRRLKEELRLGAWSSFCGYNLNKIRTELKCKESINNAYFPPKPYRDSSGRFAKRS